MNLVHLDELPTFPVSHNGNISKHVLLAGLPGGVNFCEATFPPGETAPAHSHTDLCEIFYFTSGSGTVTINGEMHAVSQGSCLLVGPGDMHEITNTGTEALQVIYFALNASPQSDG